MWYNTTRQIIEYKVHEATVLGVDQGYIAYGIKVSTNGSHYFKIGWQAEQYVALNGKAKKLVKLVLEQGKASSDKKTLNAGETWDIGDGWTLKLQSTNPNTRQALLILSKDGVKKDEKVAHEGQVYTYVESNIAGESDVPLFATYVDSVFNDIVQLRYTWAVSTNVTQVNGGDKFGAMKVSDAGDITLKLWNEDSSITLSKGSTADIMGGLKFKVADSDTPRFYPMVTRTTPGIHEVRGEVFDQGDPVNNKPAHTPDSLKCAPTNCVLSWDAFNFAGFWYDLKNGLMSETMTITSMSADSRTINQKSLWYNTTKQIIRYKVNEANISNLVEEGYGADGVKRSAGGGYYYKIGWQADEPYVALNGKARKPVKLVIEQGLALDDKKILSVGETWDIGSGWQLKAQAINTTSGRARFILSKDGMQKDDKAISQGHVYTYVERSMGGESDVPLFVTFADAFFTGIAGDIVQLRYTWAVDTNVTQVKGGDKFGVMRVSDAGDDTLKLWNEDSSLSVSKDSTSEIMGNLKFKVADSDIPRFYPVVEVTIGGNQPPVAVAGPDRTAGVGEVVQFNGSLSYDPDGFIARYTWDFGDNQQVISSEITPGHAYTTQGNYTARLTVTDDQGASSSANVKITVTQGAVVGLRGDMNCNGRLDTGDATIILRMIVGLPVPRCWG